MNDKTVKKVWVFFVICLVVCLAICINDTKPYLERYNKEITAAKSLLTDDYSKEIFDELTMFNANKTPMKKENMDKFPENYCPNVPLKKGDVIINGGISSDLTLSFKMAESVGENGLVIGFDPNVRILAKINEDIKKSGYTNIKPYSYGLWDKNCHKELYFQDNADASLIYRKDEGLFLPATLVKLDDFVVKEGVKTVNFITLDVEGAEMNALKGAETILLTQKPNLAISIHHRPTDLFEIINYLNSLNCGYKFWLGYHAPYSVNSVNVLLYATVK